MLPYTQMAEVNAVEIGFEWNDARLGISADIEGFARHDLGSRAILAANICATTIVDMLGEHGAAVTLEQVRITSQRGGLQGLAYDFEPPVQVAILVVSDAVAAGHKEDRAGAIVRERVEKLAEHGVQLTTYEIIGDDAEKLDLLLDQQVAAGVELVLTVGGTGMAHTDITVEVVGDKVERDVPGLMEMVRSYGQELTPVAFMSRGVAGLIEDTLIVTLPGSRGGARESCAVFFPAVLHVFKTLRKSRAVL
jgi:molybdenum cofactor synthesis domain-containing protein